jgi:hypothetical protein
MNDIIPPKKTIRDIPLPEGRQKRVVPEVIEDIEGEQKENMPPPPPPAPIRRTVREGGSRKFLWIAVGAVLLGIIFAFFVFGANASVEIKIKNESIPVSLNATSTTDGEGGTVPYSIVTLEKTGDIGLQATTTGKTIERKASGTITIFNNHGAESQTLVATTRFQSPEGLVYRIDKSVTVPGQSIQNGQTVPGSIDAVVFADQSGPKYNIGKVDFIIPGFQGTDKATTMYAKSKTDMTGGYIGDESIVSDSELNAKRAELQDSLRTQLVQDALETTPDQFVFFPDGMALDFTSSTEVQNGKTVLRGKAVALAPVFNKKILTELINQQNNTRFTALEGFENLNAELSNVQGLIAGDFPPIGLSLSGDLSVGQEINVGELQRALAGRPKSELSAILEPYSSVGSASAKLSPFWKSRFPSNGQNIDIEIINE